MYRHLKSMKSSSYLEQEENTPRGQCQAATAEVLHLSFSNWRLLSCLHKHLENDHFSCHSSDLHVTRLLMHNQVYTLFRIHCEPGNTCLLQLLERLLLPINLLTCKLGNQAQRTIKKEQITYISQPTGEMHNQIWS